MAGTKYNLKTDLYKYQQEDVDKLSLAGSSLVLNEMGTGKTPTALGVVESLGAQSILIVCPNSIRLEWKRQIDEWVGESLTAVATNDSYTKMGPILYSYSNGQRYKIINYEAFRSEQNLEVFSGLPFDAIIFDEIHKARNPKTKMVSGVKDKYTREVKGGLWKFLGTRPDIKILGLSGSPIMNYPNDLYVPLSIIQPKRYSQDMEGFRSFMYKYTMWSDGQYGAYVYGTRNLPELRREIEPFTIRRTKAEVLPFLPEKYYRRPLLEMQPDQKKVYKEMEENLRVLLDTGEPLWSTNVLSTLTRLRQMNLDPRIVGITTSSAKSDFLQDLVESTDEKIVVFSTFEKYIDLLSTDTFKDVSHVAMTGKVPVDKRQELVKRFQEDPSIKLFLGTVQTAGEGITLTAASNCVLADRWWSQPANSQAEDRLHRIGQLNKVQVLLPVVKDSVDEAVDSILQRKHEFSQAFYSEEEVKRSVFKEALR